MVDKQVHPSTIDPATLAQLACPACYSDLRFENSRLPCTGCSRVYLIADDVPLLIIERAELPLEER
jgi:uncharacterized protein YbaR (Trm112 family)